MRSTLVTACALIVGTYAPATSVRQHLQHTPAQAQVRSLMRQAQTEGDRELVPRPDIRRSNTSVAAKSAVARREAESLWRSGGPATDSAGAVGLLLALALLNGAGAAPPAISRPEIN
jgi:hypothetical protein